MAPTPCLWFDGDAEEAAALYTRVFPRSSIGAVSRYGADTPGEEGSVMTVSFTLDGQEFTGLNGGPQFPFTEAVSFMIPCADQAHIDHYWDSLTADGGEGGQCGWLKDRFGVSWQIVPADLERLMGGAHADQVMQVVLAMTKPDMALLEEAAAGRR